MERRTVILEGGPMDGKRAESAWDAERPIRLHFRNHAAPDDDTALAEYEVSPSADHDEFRYRFTGFVPL